MSAQTGSPKLIVRMGMEAKSKEDAIRAAVGLLAEAGCVAENYAQSMLRREKVANTFLGNGLAIPHGELADKGMVKKDGLAVLQIPAGVPWGEDQTATLVVAIAAKSDAHTDMLTKLAGLVTDPEAMAKINAASDPDIVRSALLASREPLSAEPAADYSDRIEWTLDYPAGLHARPATSWVEKAKAAGIPMRIRNGSKTADPRNLVGLLLLGAKAGDTLVISAEGPFSPTILRDFKAFAASLSAGEKSQAAKASVRKPALSSRRAWIPPVEEGMEVVNGVAASPGLAIGTIRRLESTPVDVPDIPVSLVDGGGKLENAIAKTRAQLKAVADDAARRLGEGDAAIFKAQATLLDDADLVADACRLMVDGHGAAWSWHKAIENKAGELASVGNEVMAGRATDLRDVGLRVLRWLAPDIESGKSINGEWTNAIIISEDFTPSDTASLDAEKVVGLATATGGPTSHTAILSRTLGIAAVVAMGGELMNARDGTRAIIDGDGGRLWLNPDAQTIDAAEKEIAKRAEDRAARAERRALPAVTSDGIRVEVAANINTADQAPLALEMGAEGVGLMRTEFLFLESAETPGEDEQFEIYRRMAQAMEGKRVIIRALDIGGDKQVPHLDLPKETNPFLGVRGSRLLLRRRDLFVPQVRALYRAARETTGISVMFPMITSVAEVTAIRELCEAIRVELSAPAIPLGIMIEVPAAAAMSDILAKHVDFFSIGTNDLTQYTLAMDRENQELAPEADGLHPAVLRMIRQTVKGGEKFGRMIGVCGGIAGDPAGAALLAGLGVTELSMTPRDIPAVKDCLRGRSHAELTELADKALEMESAEDVHVLLDDAFPM